MRNSELVLVHTFDLLALSR